MVCADAGSLSAGLIGWSRSTSSLASSIAARDARGGESCRLAFISLARREADRIHGMEWCVKLPMEWMRQRTNGPGAAVRRPGELRLARHLYLTLSL